MIDTLVQRHSRRTIGIAAAAVTAIVSGFAVFINGYGVRRFPDATIYTTAKNLVAGALLLGLLASTSSAASTRLPRTGGQRWGLLAVAVVGGSIPFVLFFEGLSRASSTDAAFIHKTLVAWVAVLAVMLLRERITALHVGAIGLILAGQAAVRGGVGLPVADTGELMILAATWLWAVEVIVAKRLLRDLAPLTVGAARMAAGSVVLIGWVAVTGRLGDLASLSASQLAWALLTGVLLTAFVAGWHYALSLAPAVDVTAVLVGGALVTAILDAAAKGTALAPQAEGLVLIAAGVAAIALLAGRRQTAPIT